MWILWVLLVIQFLIVAKVFSNAGSSVSVFHLLPSHWISAFLHLHGANTLLCFASSFFFSLWLYFLVVLQFHHHQKQSSWQILEVLLSSLSPPSDSKWSRRISLSFLSTFAQLRNCNIIIRISHRHPHELACVSCLSNAQLTSSLTPCETTH